MKAKSTRSAILAFAAMLIALCGVSCNQPSHRRAQGPPESFGPGGADVIDAQVIGLGAEEGCASGPPAPMGLGGRNVRGPGGQPRVTTHKSPLVMRVRIHNGQPADGGTPVKEGAPADLKVKPAGEGEGIVIDPNIRILRAPKGVKMTEDKVEAIMRAQPAYDGPQPMARR